MRTKSTEQQYLDFTCKSRLKVVNEYREKYKVISQLLDDNPQLVSLVHQDLAKMLSQSKRGRRSEYTSEQILRSLIVMFVEQDSLRQVVIRIENSEFLRHFVGLGIKAMMDFSFLDKAFCVLSDKTWEIMNRVLAQYAKEQEKISPEKLRLDTTVYETNIHYPTDSFLLWDSFRTLARLLQQIQQELPQLALKHRFHINKVKKLSYFITRNGGSNNKGKRRKVKSTYRKLIERVNWIAEVAREALVILHRAGYEAELLAHYIPIVEKIISQAGKPIEFGHKVLIAQTGEKFIHHYQVFPKREEDKELLEPTLKAHKQLFGTGPDVLATDKGFYENMKQILELEKNITTVSICKKGRRNQQEYERECTEEFKDGQRFRAGCEGSISVLKRVFNLGRCLFKGFKNYAASVGCAVFCHNLILLTRL